MHSKPCFSQTIQPCRYCIFPFPWTAARNSQSTTFISLPCNIYRPHILSSCITFLVLIISLLNYVLPYSIHFSSYCYEKDIDVVVYTLPNSPVVVLNNHLLFITTSTSLFPQFSFSFLFLFLSALSASPDILYLTAFHRAVLGVNYQKLRSKKNLQMEFIYHLLCWHRGGRLSRLDRFRLWLCR